VPHLAPLRHGIGGEEGAIDGADAGRLCTALVSECGSMCGSASCRVHPCWTSFFPSAHDVKDAARTFASDTRQVAIWEARRVESVLSRGERDGAAAGDQRAPPMRDAFQESDALLSGKSVTSPR